MPASRPSESLKGVEICKQNDVRFAASELQRRQIGPEQHSRLGGNREQVRVEAVGKTPADEHDLCSLLNQGSLFERQGCSSGPMPRPSM